jgi:hypothetical protein
VRPTVDAGRLGRRKQKGWRNRVVRSNESHFLNSFGGGGFAKVSEIHADVG